jgi:hypothetical protein
LTSNAETLKEPPPELNFADERRQRLGVAGGGRSEHEAVAQIADHHMLWPGREGQDSPEN